MITTFTTILTNLFMSKKGSKYYTVWKGVTPGVYENWNDCKRQIDNFEGALYKSFATKEEATEAYNDSAYNYIGLKNKSKVPNKPLNTSIIQHSLSVDAACSGNPGDMEYRGVMVDSKTEIFKVGPLKYGTNNIGEFLALVHALALLKQKKSDLPIYTDSVNAMLWVKNKKCKTKLEKRTENETIFDMIERAEKWLNTNVYTTKIMKWETKEWGEIPADFGRKK